MGTATAGHGVKHHRQWAELHREGDVFRWKIFYERIMPAHGTLVCEMPLPETHITLEAAWIRAQRFQPPCRPTGWLCCAAGAD
jgi:hypothetical protein